MSSVTEVAEDLIVESGGWRRWLLSFILVGASIAVMVWVTTAFFAGDTFAERLGAAYRVLWENTTQRQFTEIMRENPWLLIIPGVAIIFVTGLLLPLNQWSRAIYVYLAFGLGAIFGHVFWT